MNNLDAVAPDPIQQGHIPCSCGEYTHIVRSSVLRLLPNGYRSKHHPDRGGSAAQFDEVEQAFRKATA